MIKMNRKTKNNLNFSKDLSLNIKFSSKNNESIFKANDKSLDIVSSPIKNNKKVIKRNTRTNSYNSFLYNQTENMITNKNPFNSNIISVDSNNKINQKKNLYTFSNGEWTLGQNSKTKNNLKKNIKIKNNGKGRTKAKNITAHQSTSNLAKYNINISTDNNINNNFINDNISNEYINVNTNPNKVPQFISNKKKNTKINNRSHFQHSNLLNSNEFNYLNNKDKDKEKDKYHFRNNNYTSKNLLFLTRPNINSKKFLEKNKISISKNIKHQHQQALNEKFFNSNIKAENNFQKSKKLFKNVNTTKNSEEKNDYKLNMNRISNDKSTNITNLLELSTDEQNKKFLNEFELLYNCLKKRNDTYNKGQRNKSGSKNNNIKFKKNKYNLLEDEDSLLGIIYENKQIKQKNEELSKQVENIKKEVEQMKKDNMDIKEELKEKTKSLKDIKLSMDIFSQELLKLQTLYKEKENDRTANSYNISLNLKENDINTEKEKSIGDVNDKNRKNNEFKINNININKINTKNINLKNIIDNTNNHIYKNDKDKDKDSINNYETDINNIIISNNNICLPKKTKLEKIHQLSLNNINNIINQQNKKRGGSLEANTFQDTSKIINIETKDTTEKENECLNDKWPSPLYIEKEREKEKENKNKENSKEIDDTNSVDLSNISLADNLNINQEVYKNALNMNRSNVGKLDFKNKLDKKGNEDNKIKKTPKKINLISQGIVNDNFNEEFLKYYDKFSDSWRKEVDKMLKKGKEKE